MRQVATIRQAETHDAVVGLDQCCEGSKVSRRARVRLDVDAPHFRVEIKRLKRTLPAKFLELVDVLVTTVVTSAGQTL